MLHAGVVVIGRNEGERLRRCLAALGKEAAPAVYVDSGSTDGSVGLARAGGFDVVELDPALPFSAARARHAGYRRLLERHPGIVFAQFVDGDCELEEGWMAHARAEFAARPGAAIVAGRLREREPERSIFNRVAELEWNFAGEGEVEAVGGVFMVRCAAYDEAGGFDATVPAGEEPELCQRLRRKGWKIIRVARVMAAHDLDMTRWSQWWRRVLRFGYASADVGARFALSHYQRNNARVRFWGFCALALVGAIVAWLARVEMAAAVAAMLAALWLAQWLRISLRTRRAGHAPSLSLAYGFLLMLSYVPQAFGQALYALDALRRVSPRLVEHKSTHGFKS